MKQLVYIAAIGLLAVGCGPKTDASDTLVKDLSEKLTYVHFEDADTFLPGWSTENHVVFHWVADPPSLHPTNDNHINKYMVFQYTQGYLIRLDIATLELRADIAKTLPVVSADGLSYAFELRDDVTWDDGKPVTAEDVIFTYKANKCPLVANAFIKPYLEEITDVVADVKNPRKFTVRMRSKYIYNDYIFSDIPLMQRSFNDPNNVLANYSFAQFNDPNFTPDAALTAWSELFNGAETGKNLARLNGLGAYKPTQWEEGQSLILTRKEQHWTSKVEAPSPQETAYPNQILFKVIKDEAAQILEFKKQALDGSTNLSTKALLELKQDPEFVKNYNSEFIESFTFMYMAFNMKPEAAKRNPFFTDVNVRRALAHLTPVNDIIQVVYEGKAKRMVGPVSPIKKEHNNDLVPIDVNVEQAQTLLEQAGWKDLNNDGVREKTINGKTVPLEVELLYPAVAPITKDIADMVAEYMAKGGVRVKTNGVDMNILTTNAATHNFDMLLSSFGSSSTPDDFKQLWHTSSWENGGSNYAGFGDAASDALIDSIRFELRPEVRHPMVKRFQKMVYDAQPWVFMMANYRKIILHKRFGNSNMYFERPGVMLNNLRLLAPPSTAAQP